MNLKSSHTLSPMRRSIVRNAFILAVFSLVSTALVVFTDKLTREKIKTEKNIALNKILHQIVPETSHDNILNQDCISVFAPDLLGTKKTVKIFRARQKSQPVALLLLPIAPDGYNGNIELVVGINHKKTITGVRVLSHIETPGLGDKVEYRKSKWVDGFLNRSLIDPLPDKWAVKKDGGIFDAMTGATITPRAVVKAVVNTLKYVSEHEQELYQKPSECVGVSS